ncbi:hypothetical protein HMPREF1555_01383 [Porphyromonas gingivalis F0570]|uniref:Uncharacterized protein n=1 Tax=Porphyromonas gingivalis F0570 TaxID=1227271 RepID=A0A0E2M4U1_PORGN|nr:hypothetical protein HMPREF1555_01383 [Porphyromonas gingivalis F0570]
MGTRRKRGGGEPRISDKTTHRIPSENKYRICINSVLKVSFWQ